MIESDASTKFSPSKLAAYKECPRKYQYRYIDKLPRGAQSVEAFLGTCVHKALEALYEGLQTGRRLQLPEVVAVFESQWQAGYSEAILRHDPSILPEHWREVGRRCIENYYNQWAPFEADQTVAVERRVGFPISLDGHEYRLEGFIDRLALGKDGAFEIHDIKTAKTLPVQEHVDKDWQLALYEIAVRHQWPDTKDVRLVWHYVRHGKSLVSRRTAAQLKALAAEAAAVIGAIKRDHEFAPKQSALCDWCEYRSLCPLFAHGEKMAKAEPRIRAADEGVRAVDELELLNEKKRALRAQIKELEAKEQALERQLLSYAQAGGFEAVVGTNSEAVIKIKEDWKLPTKSLDPDRLAALEAELKASPIWGEVSQLNAHHFLELYKGRSWPREWMRLADDMMSRFAQRVREQALRLRRRRDTDE